MTKKIVLIMGNHPLKMDLKRQYENRDYDVISNSDIISDCVELVLLSDANSNDPYEADHAVIAQLVSLADGLEDEKAKEGKIVCHLLLQTQQVLRQLQTTDFCDAIRQKIDVYPFTMDEVWSRSIVPDYEPITIQSEKHVHLVIFGKSEMAEMVAMQAALIAHYPNYVYNHTLRTRITMINENAEAYGEELRNRYRHLFDNSYYRLVKPSEETPVTLFHYPMYEGEREDFVDIEWEFVEAASWHVDVREKLQLWAEDEKQVLTVVIANKDGNMNLNDALHLPEELHKRQIPIYIYTQEDKTLTSAPYVKCFGMKDKGYDVTLPLVRMAKNVNYVYDRCYEENIMESEEHLRFAVEIDTVARERSWQRLSNVKRMSNIYNAMTIVSKMRSIGLSEDDWEHFYDISQQDIETLAQVEHNRWSVEELIQGFRPCTKEEQEYIEGDVKNRKGELKARMIHYDLRAYDDLRADGTGKSVKVYDRCICSCLPLIAKAYADEENERTPSQTGSGNGGET